jgi:hypothetical protein
MTKKLPYAHITTENEPKLRKKALEQTILSTPYWINRFPEPVTSKRLDS